MTDFIRSTAKAIIVKDGKVLLNRCMGERIGEYYSLPGGGQHRFEPLEDAVRRECLEETGLHVRVLRLVAVCEEIWDSEEMRQAHPKYCTACSTFSCASRTKAWRRRKLRSSTIR